MMIMKKQSKKGFSDVGPRRWTIPETGSDHTTKQTLPNINRSNSGEGAEPYGPTIHDQRSVRSIMCKGVETSEIAFDDQQKGS